MAFPLMPPKNPDRNALVGGALAWLFAATSAMSALPEGFVDEPVLSGLRQPVALEVLPDGRLLVLERDGSIFITDPADAVPVAASYLDLPGVDDDGEKGLLNIVLDPDFANNGYLYLYYHHAATDRARISRFVHDVDHAHVEDEVLVWEDHITTSGQIISDHWGGGMSFGPNGRLYLAIGDKKDNPAEAQDLTKSAGKLIRVDPSGIDTLGPWVRGGANAHLVAGNPFVDGVGGNLDEIWGLGMRNPFRAHWDLDTGRLFISEVGSNVQSGADASWEDVHAVSLADAGVNFGWPTCEGPVCSSAPPPNYSPPAFSIQHTDSRAIVAGPVYRATRFPLEYRDAVLIADFSQKWLRYLPIDPAGALEAGIPSGGFEIADSGDLGAITDLEVGNDGAVYYTDLVARWASSGGEVRRVTYYGDNQPPAITSAVADITASPTAPATVQFTGAATDPDGDPVSYEWDFGDGTTSSSASPSHQYAAKGFYFAVLRVDDGSDLSTSDPIPIVIGEAPVPSIDSPADGTVFRAGDTIELVGSVTDADGPIDPADLRWTVEFFHDDHYHPIQIEVPGTPGAVPGTSVLEIDVPQEGHDFSGDTAFRIQLGIVDADGLPATEVIVLDPEKVDIDFSSNVPGGISFIIDQIYHPEPFGLDSLIGFHHGLEVPELVLAGGDRWVFSHWSHGPVEAATSIVVPDADQGYVANYVNIGPPARAGDGLLALYTFNEGQGTSVADVSGSAPPLDLEVTDPGAVSWGSGTLELQSSTMLRSNVAATAVNNAIAAAGELTMEAWVTPANLSQTGPARIVSLSTDSSNRNLTLGQGGSGGVSGDRVNVRLRTTTTGNNGNAPSLETAAGDLQQQLSHLVYTRGTDGSATIFVDGFEVTSGTIGGDLSNWDPGYELLVGNEASGDRPWLGTLHLLAIYDRELDAAEVGQNLAAGPDASGSANQPPVAADDLLATTARRGLSGNLLGDHGNGIDQDPDGDPLVVAAVNGSTLLVGAPVVLPSGARLSVLADGSFEYDPAGAFDGLAEGAAGSDSFTYTIRDDELAASTATVQIDLTGLAPAPVVTRASLGLERVAAVPGASPVAMKAAPDGSLVVLRSDGSVVELDPTTGDPATLAVVADHGIESVAGLGLGPGGELYLSGHEVAGAELIRGIVQRGVPDGSGGWTWSRVATTADYEAGPAGYNHGFGAVVLDEDAGELIVASGSRTDHGEVRDAGAVPVGTREVGLTGVLLRIPADGNNLLLPNDRAQLDASSRLLAEGVRKVGDLAIDRDGAVFGVEHGAEIDLPDELNCYRNGLHFGFPWRMGGADNPQQFAGYDPLADLLQNPAYPAFADGSWSNDPGFPPAPASMAEPVLNLGPDADWVRSAIDGSWSKASATGGTLASFTPHRNPAGLVFDREDALAIDFRGDAFVLGSAEGSSTSPDGRGPHGEAGEDLLHLDLDRSLGEVGRMRARILATGFAKPVDAVLVGHELFVVDGAGDQELWKVTLPATDAISPSLRLSVEQLPGVIRCRVTGFTPVLGGEVRLLGSANLRDWFASEVRVIDQGAIDAGEILVDLPDPLFPGEFFFRASED